MPLRLTPLWLCRRGILSPSSTLCVPASLSRSASSSSSSTISSTSEEVIGGPQKPITSSTQMVTNVLGFFGQPHPLTHPHLLKHDEINRGITRNEFCERRKRLAESLRWAPPGEKPPGSQSLLSGHSRFTKHLAVIPASQRTLMYDAIPHSFRQNSDYRYLTGGLEPDCVLVMEIDRDYERSHLFLRDRNAKEEQWEGPRTRAGPETEEFFGVNQCHFISDLGSFLRSYRRDAREFLLWYDYLNPKSDKIHSAMMEFISDLSPNQSVHSPRQAIHQLRVIKSAAEIALMRRTCAIGAAALRDAMLGSRRCSTELQLLSIVDHSCRIHSDGAQMLAYPPVVASGVNATTVHYTQCTQALHHGDLVLLDAGCEYHGYASDITRTWPVSGKFSDPQRVLYEVTLEVQKELEVMVRDRRHGIKTSVDSLYHDVQASLLRRLKEAGILRTEPVQHNEWGRVSVREICPHHVSHFLGMDVHDTTTIDKSLPLMPGSVITVEPGVYIPASGRSDVPKEFWGLGVRIEDDILITEGGLEILSEACPKSVSDIENLFNRHPDV